MKKLFQGRFTFAGAKVALFFVVVQLLSLGAASAAVLSNGTFEAGNDDGCGVIYLPDDSVQVSDDSSVRNLKRWDDQFPVVLEVRDHSLAIRYKIRDENEFARGSFSQGWFGKFERSESAGGALSGSRYTWEIEALNANEVLLTFHSRVAYSGLPTWTNVTCTLRRAR